ncbi:MAG: Glucosyl-3-phosphoglycerate synthase [Syntrophorhabdaceae bacterium PtaU1.Bin034]|nr:MAG: Glucosyl-3-phosphoglycerate synthase [Syntrophorhabdaceae bacterium PtaU1.Bin034]
MGDFYQMGVIATFHRMGKPLLESIETQLEAYTSERPIALVLPSLYSELKGEALRRIVSELKEVKYIRQIVVTLGPASKNEFKHAKDFFSVLPQETRIIWNNSPAMSEIYRTIESRELYGGEVGKGRSVWMAFGYILSGQGVHAIALHDCDIVGYDRSMLARLCYPVANPNLDYDFCKGYYARVTNKMHGRVTRLLVVPLIRSLQKILGPLPLLTFFDSFRYALSGEFSMDATLARINRIPGDWGLEVGVLSEVYRNTALRRICQVDISEGYDHKHQELSPRDRTKGLHKMAVDICQSLLRTFKSEGIVFPNRFFETLIATYVRTAQDMVKWYEDDAAVNRLEYDRHEETLAVETFMTAIKEASDIIMGDPVGTPLIESWDRVTAAIPDILNEIRSAVEEDNK